MSNVLKVSAVAGILSLMTTHLVAQDVTPVIYFSPTEAAKVKQATEALRSAEVRNRSAVTTWQNFDSMFRAAHPEMAKLMFSSDFRYAIARTSGQYQSGRATVVELSPDDRQKGQAALREMQESRRAFDEAQKSWADTWHQLVLDHDLFGGGTGSGYIEISLPGGAPAKIFSPWTNGIALTPDYRIAVPN